MSATDRVSPHVEMRDLATFVAVATNGSFRAAAASLFTTQPTVTRSIARLESALQARLVERGPRGSKLTPAGTVLLSKARALLDLVDEIAQDQRAEATRTLRLGAAATAAGSYLAQFLAAWIPSHSATRIQVVEDGAGRLARRLLEGEVDAAIIASPIPTRLESLPVTRVVVCAHVPPGHALAATTAPLSVADCIGYPLLLNHRSFISAQLLWREFEHLGARPNVVYESSVGQTLGALAEAGVGVALFSDSVDLRQTSLVRRPLVGGDGLELAFDLRIAWRTAGTPSYVTSFCAEMSAFSKTPTAATPPTTPAPTTPAPSS